MKKRISAFTRILALLLALLITGMMAVTPAFAATVEDATVDTDRSCSLTVYKYDFTNAAKDGVWSHESYVSTGRYDDNVNTILGGATREGAEGSTSYLENGSTSEGYAISGVEFSYLKIADLYQYSESENNGTAHDHVELLYRFDKALSAAFLRVIGLADGLNSHKNANALDESAYFYQSDVIIAALNAALISNATAVKDALESYVLSNGGTAMDLTNSYGCSKEDGMETGLYLLAETKVSENVTVTCNPFLVSLPMTSVSGGGDGSEGNDFAITDGGNEWLYDVVIYPKNESGIPTLIKEVREDKAYTGHNDDTTAINDGFDHYGTASAGDRLDYQIVSTMPTITSNATALSFLEYKDLLSAGIRYDDRTPIIVEWFTDKGCTDSVAVWSESDELFSVKRVPNADGSATMTVALTEAGLEVVNGNAEGQVGRGIYKGYSNYTLRISYSAFMNSDNSLVYGDKGNDNKVVMTWKRSSSEYYDTLIDDCHVFVYGIELTKKFSDDKGDYGEVTFVVQNKSDGYFVQAKLNEKEGVYYVTGFAADESAATSFVPVPHEMETSEGVKTVHKVFIKGLENDEYIVTETNTADGYVLPKENIHINISAVVNTNALCDIYSEDTLGVIQNDARFSFDGGMDLSLANIPQMELAHYYLVASSTVDENKTSMIPDGDSSNAFAILTVNNTKGWELPQTGEVGTRLMPIIGVTITVVVMGAFALFMMPKRKDEEND